MRLSMHLSKEKVFVINKWVSKWMDFDTIALITLLLI